MRSSKPTASGTKRPSSVMKDREALLAFYDFPAEHWKHLRRTNPIESTFATVRHRTVRSRGCVSNKTPLAMIFKLTQAAKKRWHRLRALIDFYIKADRRTDLERRALNRAERAARVGVFLTPSDTL